MSPGSRPGRVRVRRAALRLPRRQVIWLPWYTVSCPCCGWQEAAWSGWARANRVALLHAAVHSPTRGGAR